MEGKSWARKPTLGHNLLIDLITSSHPGISIRAWKASLLSQTKTTIKCNPKHDFRVSVILFSASDFPDGHVGILPDSQNVVCASQQDVGVKKENVLTQYLANGNPLFPSDRLAVLIVEIYSVHEFTVNIKLQMECSSVANTDRFAVSVARKMTGCVSAIR